MTAGPRLTRRRFLHAGVGGAGSAVLAAACTGSSHPRASHTPAAATPANPTTYFSDAELNFQTLFALGSAGYGISEVGEVLSAVQRVNAAGASYQSFYDQFWALGGQLADNAQAALNAGHPVTARSCYLRSAEYYSQALYFVLGTNQPTRTQEAMVYAAMQASWAKATALFSPAFEPVIIPYQPVTLPGYLLKPDSSGRRRPTVILNNGSDAQNVDLYAFGGAAALARGYNALIFEGPGQGSLLFEHDLPFTPAWENVITPVVDMLLARPDVDAGRIAIVGWSFCGASVAQAAAHEHRLAAVILDPGVNSIIAPYNLGKLLALANAGDRSQVNDIWAQTMKGFSPEMRFVVAKRSEVFGQTDFYDQIRYMEQFTLDPATIGQITAPTLVTQAEQEQFYPGQSQQVYGELRAPKQLITFTVAQGAEFHDEPMAPQTRNEALFDWLDTTLH